MHYLNEIEAKGAPVFLNALVHEQFIKNGHKVAMSYPWGKVAPAMKGWAPAPPELWLITSDRRYAFDFDAGFGGFIVSQALLDVLLAHSDGWHVSRLHVVNGKNEPVTDKTYHLIQPGMALNLPDAMDKTQSKFSVDEWGGVDEVTKLVFNAPAQERSAFVCMGEPILWPFLFVSEALAQVLGQQKWVGLEVAPVEAFSRDLRL